MSRWWTISLGLSLWLAAAHAAGAGVPAFHFGGDWRPMDALSCTVKAIEAMEAQHFIEGTRSPGVAWGFNEQSLVLVRGTPHNDGVAIEVLAFSRSDGEAERLRNEVRISVFDERRPDLQALHPDHFQQFDGQRAGHYPAVHWGTDTRPKDVSACVHDAELSMKIAGLQSSVGGSFVQGQSAEVAVLVSCVPIAGGVSILVAATSDDGQVAERYRNDVRTVTFDGLSFDWTPTRKPGGRIRQ